MTPKAVIFDIGNVLIEWNPERFYDSVIGIDRRRALFSSVDLDGMNEAVDLGAPFTETIYAMADAHPEWDSEIRLWHDRWIEMASPAIDRSVRLLRSLRTKGIPVFSLSNFGIGSFDHACTFYPFLREFDRQFISGHMGVIKPDAEIYRRLEVESGLDPQALLFADDRPANIEAAATRGWQTHLFDGPDGWASQLVDSGLLSEEESR